jgi:MarR family transcriptional regulator, lower aerobic nicotinate degradation pathway regulator
MDEGGDMPQIGTGGNGTLPAESRSRPSLVLRLERTPGHLLRRAQQVHTALWLAQFERDLTSPQFALLLAMAKTGPLDQNSVGQIVSLDKSTAADVIVRLQKHGWLDRTRDPADGRRKLLTLTRAARAALPNLTVGVVDVQRRLLEPIDPPRRQWFIDKLAMLAYIGDVPTPGISDQKGADTAGDLLPLQLRLERAPGHLIRRAEQLHGSLWSTWVGPRLTPSQYGLLTAVASEHLLDQSEAGERASLDKSSTSDIAARLIRHGLMGREKGQDDKRRKRLYLTDDAWKLMEQVDPAVRAVQTALVERVAARDREMLTDLLKKVAYRK